MNAYFMVTIIFIVLDSSLGLGCSKCTHMNNKDPSLIFQTIALPKNQLCASIPASQMASGVEQVNCPANPPSGQVYKCGSYNGTVDVNLQLINAFSIPGLTVNVTVDIVYRGCVLMGSAIPNNCIQQNNIATDNNILKGILKSALSGRADINTLTFVGIRCVNDQNSMINSFSRSTAIHKNDLKIVLCIMVFAIMKCVQSF